MKVTQVSILPTEASRSLGRPALTPELLAATGARYSRNNEGLNAILERIDPNDLDGSVESIFRMIDYGHQSIADMVPVSMFVDGVSLWLAYHIWSIVPTGSGQESSTRYIRLVREGMASADELGIPKELRDEWQSLMDDAFAIYSRVISVWDEVFTEAPAIARIPDSIIDDQSESGRKRFARMMRNFTFDRARYFIPVAARTNMMLLMSARGWVQLCQQLLAHPAQEAQHLGAALRDELGLVAPRMLRHAVYKDALAAGIRSEFADWSARAEVAPMCYLDAKGDKCTHPSDATLDVMRPDDERPDLASELRHHDNRYGWVGPGLRRTAVRFGWQAVALAEIRDLNRHRTGTKHCPLVPLGFYYAGEQLPAKGHALETLIQSAEVGRRASRIAREQLAAGQPSYIYWTLLGTQYSFEHLTTADKFLYEAELRTGVGAHFRYARHFRELLSLWYEMFPETKGLVLEGGAEPE